MGIQGFRQEACHRDLVRIDESSARAGFCYQRQLIRGVHEKAKGSVDFSDDRELWEAFELIKGRGKINRCDGFNRAHDLSHQFPCWQRVSRFMSQLSRKWRLLQLGIAVDEDPNTNLPEREITIANWWWFQESREEDEFPFLPLPWGDGLLLQLTIISSLLSLFNEH